MTDQYSVHPLDYMAVVHRRKWWFVAPLVLCLAAGAAAVVFWPKTYLSRAAIGVQSPALSPDFLKGVSSMDPTERQRAVQQLLFSPEVIDRAIREEKINRAKPGAGAVNGAVAVSLAPGGYWWCENVDNGTVVMQAQSNNSVGPATSLLGDVSQGSAGTGAASPVTGIQIAQTFGTWPAWTANTVWTEPVGSVVPYVLFRVANVP